MCFVCDVDSDFFSRRRLLSPFLFTDICHYIIGRCSLGGRFVPFFVFALRPFDRDHVGEDGGRADRRLLFEARRLSSQVAAVVASPSVRKVVRREVGFSEALFQQPGARKENPKSSQAKAGSCIYSGIRIAYESEEEAQLCPSRDIRTFEWSARSSRQVPGR